MQKWPNRKFEAVNSVLGMKNKAEISVQLDSLTEEERRALRRSRFSSPPPTPSPNTQPRLAHPGGPVATNKAVALAKFLQRKLQEPGGSASLDPDLVERAVQDAKSALRADANSESTKRVRHVVSFPDDAEETDDQELDKTDLELDKPVKAKKKKQKKKNKQKWVLTSSSS
ncbi:hypothetical protein SUGI_0974420 [Cryptomeria japonica]|uniref:uncharacterized protein LOC131073910 n=1 Tax=Cryptomeria japonica TaxID=3369 RepID=UPI002414925E|nr:uncharacterized protein LOC131073910 [Cryptomeria japonica]GLJ46250.1 hypothetical protein SUGI_0974420 [Cryptomeria japonica]